MYLCFSFFETPGLWGHQSEFKLDLLVQLCRHGVGFIDHRQHLNYIFLQNQVIYRKKFDCSIYMYFV